MDLFVELFGSMLAFVYHCFDRIVIHGYLSSLSRPDQVVYFFRQVVGVPVVSKEVLSRRTADYQSWVEAFARNHKTPIEWAEKGVRKEDHVRPHLRRMTQQESYGVYFIFKSLEQGSTFRISVPKYATKDPNHRILAPQRSRFTHYYFYIRDEVLGPMVMRVASFFPFRTSYYLNGHSFIEQELKHRLPQDRQCLSGRRQCGGAAGCRRPAEPGDHPQAARLLDPDPRAEILRQGTRADEAVTLLCHQSDRVYFIFKRNFPIHKLFERSCEIGLWRLTATKIAEIFGTRLNRRMKGKLATVIEQIEHGHHVFRAYFKNSFLKQYEKFSTFLRNELVSNNLKDLGLKKGLDNLDAVRQKFLTITDRFAGSHAQWLNVHADFPLLQRLALPVTLGRVRYPGIQLHDPRVIRLLEVLLQGGLQLGGWTAEQIHEAVCTTFHLSAQEYRLNQLRYDLRKLKGHGLVERDGSRYAYRLTAQKGVQVALLFLFFHKRLLSPTAASTTVPTPNTAQTASSKPPTTAPTKPSTASSNCLP